jgi:serine/threonine protein kinase/Flp pilus assembly protein TadD
MKPERLNIIDQLFQSALDLAPEQRSGFLDERCAGDPELRGEVESLVAAHEKAGNFIESSASDVAAQLLTESGEDDTPVGKSIGQYKIMGRLGTGGMGEVYRATDKMGRQVALKIINRRLSNDEQAVGRFLREAQAVLSLNHPNIVTVFDIDRTDTTHYIASELIEGQSLRERLQRKGEMKVSEALDIAIQVGSALGAAHEKGIVHRDIKPENIMLRPDGYAKVVDFGIAKLVEVQSPDSISTDVPTKLMIRTSEGMAIGTVHYMSPEQARGLSVDVRTDTWSLGVVLYEMVGGRRPFDGDTAADVLSSVLERQPPPVSRFSAEVPETLEWIVNKALRKEKGERYQTAGELLTDLKELRKRREFAAEQERSGQLTPGKASQIVGENIEQKTVATPVASASAGKPHTASSAEYVVNEIKRHKRAGLITLMAILIAAAIGAYFHFSKTNNKTINSIAVLPLVNVSGDPNMEYLSDGISESLINSLSRLSALRVMARSTAFRYKGRETDPQRVGSELGVDAVLTGRVVQRGDTLVVQADLVNVADGTQLWGEQYNRKLTDLVALQIEIARDVSQKLKARLSGEDEQRVAKNYTNNVEAYQLYLKGRYYYFKLTQPEIRKGIALYQQAIDADPAYALAYAGMADAYRTLPFAGYVPSKEAFPQAKSAAKRALEIDENLAEAHIVLGWVGFSFDWDWTAAESELKKAIELSPNNSDGHRGYAHLFSLQGRHDEAIAEIKRARELDPLTLITNALEGQFLSYAGRNDEAIARLKQTLEIDPNFWIAHNNLGRAYIRQGRYDEAIAELNRAKELSGGSTETFMQLGYALAKSGKRKQAQATLEELKSFAVEHYVPAYGFAMIHNGLGEKDEALKYLEKSFQEREVQITFIKIDTRWDDLRAEPRFQALLQGVGLKP